MKITIKWKRCLTYEAAKNFTGVIYLHEWDGKPFYWGKAERSYFGGNSRKNSKGEKVEARYNSGYRHWIEGCLQNGAKLYFGRIDGLHSRKLSEVEKYLIRRFQTGNNRRIKPVDLDAFELIHSGEIPECISHPE